MNVLLHMTEINMDNNLYDALRHDKVLHSSFFKPLQLEQSPMIYLILLLNFSKSVLVLSTVFFSASNSSAN